MPYIKKKDRIKYDNLIDRLAYIVNGLSDNDKISGELNYIFFRLARLLSNKSSGGKQNYARIATISSAFTEAQAEFRRRIIVPYEIEKIKINGDVEL